MSARDIATKMQDHTGALSALLGQFDQHMRDAKEEAAKLPDLTVQVRALQEKLLELKGQIDAHEAQLAKVLAQKAKLLKDLSA